MNIHELMSFARDRAGGLAERLGVGPASPDEEAVSLVLEILGDGEAHTVGTIDAYLTFAGHELSGCEIAGCLARLSLDGHQVKGLPPYDGFGAPERFKLEVPA